MYGIRIIYSDFYVIRMCEMYQYGNNHGTGKDNR